MKPRALLVCSSGGHLDQLVMLLPAMTQFDLAVATFDKPDAVDKVRDLRTYWLAWPTNRNVKNLLRNLVRAWFCLRRERPELIVSSGAAPAVPFFYLSRMFGSVTIFIECFDRVDMETLTAKLVRPVTDHYIVQWHSQLAGWPRRTMLGPSR